MHKFINVFSMTYINVFFMLYSISIFISISILNVYIFAEDIEHEFLQQNISECIRK